MRKVLAKLLIGAGLNFFAGQAYATDLSVAIAASSANARFADEWVWTLRGGGVEINKLSPESLTAIPSDTTLLILDSFPLSGEVLRNLEFWVKQGGLLVYSGGAEALQESTAKGSIHGGRRVQARDLLGVEFYGYDPGLMGTYPAFVATSTLTSPLMKGDALRLGRAGIGHDVRFEALDENEVLARSARLSPGPGELVLESQAPTLVSHKYGQGRVIFVSFSMGKVAACYPENQTSQQSLDCSGAGNAHALMRWLTANLLWDERHLQIPLFWEAPGDRPHVVTITGDVHDKKAERVDWASVQMARITERLGIPLSLYIEGRLGQKVPDFLAALHEIKDLEISSHSLDGRVYLSRKYFFKSWGILFDLWRSETLLGEPHFPSPRSWLSSTRSHGWISDRGAWSAMRRAGIGLGFDHVADSLDKKTPWRVPVSWFSGGEQKRLFVPIYEHSIATGKDDFQLTADQAMNIANLASAQPEPVSGIIPYSAYTGYVKRWHGLLDRLATVGGLTEVWLWHPEGVLVNNAFVEVQQTLESFKQENTVAFVRGDVLANWRANRERFSIKAERDYSGQLKNIQLREPTMPPLILPKGAPEWGKTISYWVIGPATIPGWSSRNWVDPLGRTITVLTHGLDVEVAH